MRRTDYVDNEAEEVATPTAGLPSNTLTAKLFIIAFLIGATVIAAIVFAFFNN
jgi:hypothetical protein